MARREKRTLLPLLGIRLGLVAVIGLALLSHPIAVWLDNMPELLQSLLFLSSAIPLGTLASVLLSTVMMALVLSVLGVGLASILSCASSHQDKERRVIAVNLFHFFRS
ncbi:MAG: hypothetical protein AABZ17_04755 [Nitrospirota bacterium]|mgnify:CR=1 FL=1